jgi:hypothetical protein
VFFKAKAEGGGRFKEFATKIYNMAYKDFIDMPVWKKAFQLLLKVYKVTKTYPVEEKYGLVSDMRRAANSVTNNISEGFGKYEKLDSAYAEASA